MNIRPVYRCGQFVGFCLWLEEPIGQVLTYKQAVLLMRSLKGEI